MDPGRRRWPALQGAIALALAAALAGPCGAAAADGTAGDAARSGASLGIDLYRGLAAQGGNVFLSPYSIAEALAVLNSGAKGKTKLELLQALHWTLPTGGMAASFGAQDLQLDHAAQGGATLAVANGVWYQRGREPLASFLQTARQEFRAEVRVADFSADLPVSRRMINYWVEQKTGGKILDLMPAGALTPRTRLVLANAIYFKGKWAQPFKPELTRPGPFFTAPGANATAPLMSQSAHFKTAGQDACELLDLPYGGGELSMVILLPRKRDGLPALAQSLRAESLPQWLAALDQARPREVDVVLPRFKLAYSAELTGPLQHLGVSTAFMQGLADFSDINGGRDLYLSAVLHKAFVDVNEEGTEAAAATGIVMKSLAVEMPRKFTVDHPFIFLIRDTSTGSILFLGQVVDPR